jgi:hypothetical protein
LINAILHLGLLLLGFTLLKVFRPKDRGSAIDLRRAFLVGYVIRFAVILLLHAFSRDGIFMLDDRGYDEQGRHLANLFPVLNQIDLSDQLGTSHVAYPLMVGFVYLIGGHSILSAKLLNAFFGALLAPIMYWLASEFGGDDPGLPRRAAWLAALFPFDIAWSGLLLRDTILEVLFGFILASTVSAIKRRSYLFLGLTLLALYAMDSFRFYAIFVWAGAMTLACIAWLVRKFTSQDHRRAWIYFCAATTVAILLVIMLLPWLLRHFQLARLLALQVAGLGEGSGATPLSFGFNVGFLASLSRAVFVYLFGPFPWVFWGIDDRINYIFYPGMYVIYVLFPLFAVGLRKMVGGLKPVSVFLVAAFALHGLIEIYVFQGAPRQRMMTDSVFLLCAAIAWPLWHSFARKAQVVYAGFIVIALGHTILRAVS